MAIIAFGTEREIHDFVNNFLIRLEDKRGFLGDGLSTWGNRGHKGPKT